MDRLMTVVLGASGLVAQRLQQRLHNHPWFELSAIAGKSTRKGTSIESIPWKLDEPRPELPILLIEDVHDYEVPAKLYEEGIRIAFSALPSEHALKIEPMWAKAGITVFSNASSYRLTEGVPLVIPEINPTMLNEMGQAGFPIACATNCTLLPIIMPLAPMHREYILKSMSVRSEQALSGGGYRLLEQYQDNEGHIDAEVPGEAQKTEDEFRRILNWDGDANIVCTRIARKDGHHVFVTAKFERKISEKEVHECLEQWNKQHSEHRQPSAPHSPLMVVPKLDVAQHLFTDGKSFENTPDPASDLKAGMGIVVAAIECLDDQTVRFEGYSHNTLRGAAGGVVYLAELAYTMDKL
ncbi:MAG TPA: hypothetical protein QGI72_04165 [Poseidonia sp.]|nr:hypothetical protein [Poseidonia sp.]